MWALLTSTLGRNLPVLKKMNIGDDDKQKLSWGWSYRKTWRQNEEQRWKDGVRVGDGREHMRIVMAKTRDENVVDKSGRCGWSNLL